MSIRSLSFAAVCACLSTMAPAAAPASQTIDPARLSETTRVLASDPFQGRAPGTPGEQKTIAYLIERFKEAGLSPAGDGGAWTQAVPLVHTRLGTGTMSVDFSGTTVPLAQKQQVYVNTVRPVDRVSIAKAPLVFPVKASRIGIAFCCVER